MGIQIKAGERAAFIGTTGSGKTVLAKFLLQNVRRVIVIDPKHDFRLKGFRFSRSLPSFSNSFQIIVRPKQGDDAFLSRLFREAYRRKNLLIYCDELNSLSDNFKEAAATLQDICRTGRERRVAVWSSMQRPRYVPLGFLTETEVWFSSFLRNINDRKYLTGYMGDEVTEPAFMLNFWYIRPGMDEAELLRLEVNEPDKIKKGDIQGKIISVKRTVSQQFRGDAEEVAIPR